MTRIYNIFHSKVIQNVPNWEFLVTIWQPWSLNFENFVGVVRMNCLLFALIGKTEGSNS
jgi:hypothetical protein